MLLSDVTTPVRASVQTGDDPRGVTPANLAREGDPIGLTAEAGGFARPNHGLTTVVTGHGLRYPVEIPENPPHFRAIRRRLTHRRAKYQCVPVFPDSSR